MSKSLRVPGYLEHILQAIERIGRYTENLDINGFLNSELVQDAVLRNIEILGEAANNIQRVAPTFAARHHQIPWSVMYAMRNRVTHAYDKVDLEIVWKTIRKDLPRLHAQLEAVRGGLSPDDLSDPERSGITA